MNYTGCGNSLNLAHPHVIRFVMDSLRYWVEMMHVDGFRFDLASVLGREGGRFEKSASFFDAISQDPVLSRVKLIAEPWDLGTYQVGNFPVDWSEWNGRFRDTVRRFGKGDGGQVPELGWRLTGSADLYGDDGRSAYNSVNFITCHDGFTLARSRLVQRQAQRGQPGKEPRRDERQQLLELRRRGSDRRSRHRPLRKQQIKNFACCLLFSAGHADDPGRRRVHADAAGQQQRLLPGQRDQLVRLERRRAKSGHVRVLPEGHRRCAGGFRCCSRASSSPAGIRTTTASPTSNGSGRIWTSRRGRISICAPCVTRWTGAKRATVRATTFSSSSSTRTTACGASGSRNRRAARSGIGSWIPAWMQARTLPTRAGGADRSARPLPGEPAQHGRSRGEG